MTTFTEAATAVRHLLSSTTVPPAVVDDYLADAPDLWLASAPPELLAGDLALCHPDLRPGEVRAAARPIEDGLTRLTVMAHDRHGLLADTTGVIAASGFPIAAASAMTCRRRGIGLHALAVEADDIGGDGWDRLGARLRGIAGGGRDPVTFSPIGRARATTTPLPDGHSLITVRAPDQTGLLWAICSWFADLGISIETAHVSGGVDGWVTDRFAVAGSPDVGGLAARLSGDAGD